jgi:predicted MFS family arabinose efflux permease
VTEVQKLTVTRVEKESRLWRQLVVGVLALATGMGIGRFVYTPVVSLMLGQTGLRPDDAGLIASANSLGYLAGAMLMVFVDFDQVRGPLLRWSLAATLIAAAAMAVAGQTAPWAAIRLVSGVSSAITFVLAQSITLSRIQQAGRPELAGWLYGGVGGGIALSGLLTPVLAAVGGWRGGWLGAALVGLLVAVPVFIPSWSGSTDAGARSGAVGVRERGGWAFVLLYASYVLEGASFNLAGTFLVSMIAKAGPGWLGDGAWVLVGLSAIPSCLMWTAVGRVLGGGRALALALLVQLIGLLLPVVSDSPAAAIACALLFGGTFMGVVVLTVSAGGRLVGARAPAVLTSAYGIGQIAGPALVAVLLAPVGMRQAFLFATVLVGGAMVAAVGSLSTQRPVV